MILFAGLLVLSLIPAEARATDWKESLTPHFIIKHESPWLPPGLTMSLERMHSRLRLDLALFSPWMGKDRLNLYVYKARESYAAGEFKPPEWSNGIALYDKKAVVIYQQATPRKTLEVTAHETTHLLFESYWSEVGREPPAWINEGLAMLQESEAADKPELSAWYRAMTSLPEKGVLPFDQFTAITPTQDITDDTRAVETWYVQAYSVSYFMLRRHPRLQFKTFCAKLRDGKPLEEALWLAYRYRSLKKFQEVWLAWLKDPSHQKLSASFDPESEEKEKAPIGSIKGFKPLKTLEKTLEDKGR